MGVKKPDDYKVSKHCKERFLERFSIDSDESLDLIKQQLSGSVYVRKAKGDNQMWVNVDCNTIFIINQNEKVIVTVYQVGEEVTVDIHPDLSAIMHETVERFNNKMLRQFGSDTAPYYKELSELTEKLGKTSQPQVMAKTMSNIKKLRLELNQKIAYHQELTLSASSELRRLAASQKDRKDVQS